MLTIRGISDIVGLPRDERWTEYACHTAAAFAHALVKYGRVLPTTSLSVQAAVTSLNVKESIDQFSYNKQLLSEVFEHLRERGVFDSKNRPVGVTPAAIASDMSRVASIIGCIDNYATFYTFGRDEIVPFTVKKVLDARQEIGTIKDSGLWHIHWARDQIQDMLHYMADFTRYYPINISHPELRVAEMPFNHRDPGFDVYEKRLITMRVLIWACIARLTHVYGKAVLSKHLPKEIFAIC